MSLVAAYFISAQIESTRERVVEAIAQDVLTLANSSIAYFIQQDEWPDQVGNCANLVGVLAGVNAFPAGVGGYDGPLDVSLSANCSNLNTVGSTLRITVGFPTGQNDDAKLLSGFLPTSLERVVGGVPEVVHYVAAPRRATDRYTFHKDTLTVDTAFYLNKPDCGGGTPAYIVIPQAVCITDADHGLGGFYFRDMNDGGPTQWHLQLRVAKGDNNNNQNDFRPIDDYQLDTNNPTCGGQQITVGAVTYCE